MTTQIESLEKDVQRHEKEINGLTGKLNDLSASHIEVGFILKTYMEKIPVFEKKIDNLSEKIQSLMTNKNDWDLEKRVELVEKHSKLVNRYSIWGGIILLVLVILNPEIAPFLISVLQNKMP
jgi:chromosome segregation ATPase